MPDTAKRLDLTRFLSDFTLGFSDGLTVPFALTAGLSSLGKSDTVIYAGLAELCAGSISMGIGGYLAAVDELPASPSPTRSSTAEDEEEGMLMQDTSSDSGSDDEKASRDENVVIRHLSPLALDQSTVSYIVSSMREQPGGLRSAARQIQANYDSSSNDDDSIPVWPVMSGLSISLGYVVGGIIPLLPYFFASTVGMGLVWSIVMCLIALMAFGTGKSLLLGGSERNMPKALYSGFQMLVLGSLAALAAVTCVNLVGGGEGAAV